MFPAGETGYRVTNLTLPTGLVLRVVESGEENAPPVLLLHGWGCSAFAFHENMRAIADVGFRVIAPDMKGHGLSEKPPDSGSYSTVAMVQHIGAIADALNIERFALGGHSMGAALALRFAIASPGRVTALALIAPVGTSGLRFLSLVRLATPAFSPPFWRMLNTRWMTRFFLRLAYGELGVPSAREVEEYWAPSQFPEFTTALRHLLHRFNWGPIYIGGLDAHNIPILVLTGSRDHLCRKKTLEHIRKSLRCEMQVIEGAGHLVISETPERVNSALVALLRKQKLLPQRPQRPRNDIQASL
jgi:pimeloyl-ACP methyl ester carboxylesterase